MEHGRAAQWALAVAAWSWIGAVVLVPGLVFPIGHFICHQRPDRSFVLHGQQFAVCARCTGIYAGAAVAGPVALLAAVSLTSRGGRWLLGLAALPTLATWGLEFAGVVPFSNLTRCLAGLPLGAAAAWLVLGTLAQRPSPRVRRASPIVHP